VLFTVGRALVLCVGVLASAAPLYAQVKLPDRPYRGILGGGHDLAARHTLDFSAAFSEAYDDDVYADAGAPVTPTGRRDNGYYTNLITSGSYGWKGNRLQFAANGAATLRQYNGTQGVRLIGSTSGVGFTGLLSRRTRLFVNQSAAYSPSYLYGLFPTVTSAGPGDQIPVAADYQIDVSEFYSYGTSTELSHGVTSRATISAIADYTYTDVVRESPSRRDASAYGVRGQFSYAAARRTTWRVGYRYRSGDVGFGVTETSQSTVEHGIDVGLDHTKVISATRQAVWGLNLGTSRVNIPFGLNTEVSGRVYRVSGGATFGYQFGRSWQARATYRRGLDYIAGLSEPVYSNGFTAAVDGLLTPRWGISVSSGYSTGESALYSNASTFDTYAGTLNIRYALSRMWATNVEYVYYYYSFRGKNQLPPGVSPSLERNGLRAGLTLWMPAFRK
jgi:hypothetical protein